MPGVAGSAVASPRKRGDVVLQRVGEEAILIDPRTDQAHVVNSSAVLLWELCDGERSFDDLATAFAEPYGLSGPEVIGDVREGVAALGELGLFEDPV